MTVNLPNVVVEIKVSAEGFGRKLVQGAHHSEIEMVRVLEGVFGHPSVKPGGPNAAHIEVIGALPDSTVSVEFYVPRPAVEVPAPAPEPEVVSEPELSAEELAANAKREELKTAAKAKGIEVKSSDTKTDIATKLTDGAGDEGKSGS